MNQVWKRNLERFNEVPARDTASLVPFSNLVEIYVKAEDEYVDSSVVPGNELAILLNLLVLEVSKNELECVVPVGRVRLSFPCYQRSSSCSVLLEDCVALLH